MTTTNRPRRSLNRKTVDQKVEAAQPTKDSNGLFPAVTARLRREHRALRPRLASFGARQKKTTQESRTVTRPKPVTRSKTTRPRSTSSRHTRSMDMPTPVYIRGGMAHLPVQPRKLGAPPKRRYNVALNVPGAELHLPALPTFRASWRLVSGVLTALLLALAAYLWTSPKYHVDLVEVVGFQRLSANDINTVIGLGGESIFSVNPQKIKSILVEDFPDIKNVSVKVNLPARVVVQAQERQPVITWNQAGNEQWIDSEGNAFPPRGDVAGLILVEAKDSPPTVEKTSLTDLRFISPEMVNVIMLMASNAPKDTPLVFESEHGLGWTDPSGWQVYFGMDMKDIEAKLQVYQAIQNRLQQDGIQPVLISVEYLHAPYYRTER